MKIDKNNKTGTGTEEEELELELEKREVLRYWYNSTVQDVSCCSV